MKSTNINLVRYNEKYDDRGNLIEKEQTHLYVKTLFIGATDNIANYIEVEEEV